MDVDRYDAAMRPRLWYLIALALLVLGVAGVLNYPPDPHPDPTFVTVRFEGAATAPGTITVRTPGEHAIWATGDPRPDSGRCRVFAPDLTPIALDEPSVTVRWVSKAEDDAVYTRVATFEAASVGSYGIVCSPDPAAPGASISVSEKPDLRLSVSLVAAGVVALVASVALFVVTLVRARRRPSAARTMV